MKFKVIQTAGAPGYPENIRLWVWRYAEDMDGNPSGYFEALNIDFRSIESAKQYAQQYKNNSYEEEFEL